MLITPGVWYRKNEDLPSAHPRHFQSPLSYRLSWNEPMMRLGEGETSVRWWSRDGFSTCSSLCLSGTSENWYWNETTSPGFPTTGCSFFSYSALPGSSLISGCSHLSRGHIEIGESGDVKFGWDDSNWAENCGCETGMLVPSLANLYIWRFAKSNSRSLLLVNHKGMTNVEQRVIKLCSLTASWSHNGSTNMIDEKLKEEFEMGIIAPFLLLWLL